MFMTGWLGLQKTKQHRGQAIYIQFEAMLTSHHHLDLEILFSKWGYRPILLWQLGQFTPTLEDVHKLAQLPPFSEASATGFGLSKEDQNNMKHLIAAMAVLRSFSKSTYASWLRYFIKGMTVGLTSLFRHSFCEGRRTG